MYPGLFVTNNVIEIIVMLIETRIVSAESKASTFPSLCLFHPYEQKLPVC